MPTKYKHIFFDLDDTVWDFYANSNEALHHLFLKYKLNDHALKPEELVEVFHEVNNELWILYRNNEIDKDYLREKRFNIVFERLKNESFTHHLDFGREYLMLCPTRKNLVGGAGDVLSYLKSRYQLHVITNGFDEIARIKLECSGLRPYFGEIITSEEARSKKPAGEIFQYALNKAGADKAESIMIGNDLEADIYGAMKAGLDQVFYNPAGIAVKVKPTYEITHLSQLQKLL